MNHTILIIEDDENLVEIIDYLLSQHGYKVLRSNTYSYTGDIEKHQPVLIIVDHWLKTALGSEICLRLKADPVTAHIPLLLTSAANNIYTIGKTCNADDVLPKPFDISELESKVVELAKLNINPSFLSALVTPNPLN